MQHPLLEKLETPQCKAYLAKVHKELFSENTTHSRQLCEYLTQAAHKWLVASQPVKIAADTENTPHPPEELSLVCLIWPLKESTLFFGEGAAPDNRSSTYLSNNESFYSGPTFVLKNEQGHTLFVGTATGGSLFIGNLQLHNIPDFLCSTLPCGTPLLPHDKNPSYVRGVAYDIGVLNAHLWRSSHLTFKGRSIVNPLQRPHLSVKYSHPEYGHIGTLDKVSNCPLHELSNTDTHLALLSLQQDFVKYLHILAGLQTQMVQHHLRNPRLIYGKPSTCNATITAVCDDNTESPPVTLELTCLVCQSETDIETHFVRVLVSISGLKIDQLPSNFIEICAPLDLPLDKPFESVPAHHFLNNTLAFFRSYARSTLLC